MGDLERCAVQSEAAAAARNRVIRAAEKVAPFVNKTHAITCAAFDDEAEKCACGIVEFRDAVFGYRRLCGQPVSDDLPLPS